MRVISESASMSRSALHKKVRELRASATRPLNLEATTADNKSVRKTTIKSQNASVGDESTKALGNPPSVAEDVKQSPSGNKEDLLTHL